MCIKNVIRHKFPKVLVHLDLRHSCKVLLAGMPGVYVPYAGPPVCDVFVSSTRT